jgi:hypothetical protein
VQAGFFTSVVLSGLAVLVRLRWVSVLAVLVRLRWVSVLRARVSVLRARVSVLRARVSVLHAGRRKIFDPAAARSRADSHVSAYCYCRVAPRPAGRRSTEKFFRRLHRPGKCGIWASGGDRGDSLIAASLLENHPGSKNFQTLPLQSNIY